MLIEQAGVEFPPIVKSVRHAGRSQNIKSKILPLSAGNISVAIDPAEANAAREVGNKTAVRPHEIVSQPEIDAEIIILDASENWLS